MKSGSGARWPPAFHSLQLVAQAWQPTQVSRSMTRPSFFAPAGGGAEDPVTGSAHCCLTPYWAKRLGKAEMTGYQASARGGVVKVALVGDRVKLAGQAVTVLRGELLW